MEFNIYAADGSRARITPRGSDLFQVVGFGPNGSSNGHNATHSPKQILGCIPSGEPILEFVDWLRLRCRSAPPAELSAAIGAWACRDFKAVRDSLNEAAHECDAAILAQATLDELDRIEGNL